MLAAVLEQALIPVVIDADALNILARDGFPPPVAARPLVLTPHPGEFARIASALGIAFDAEGEVSPRLRALTEVAERLACVVILKGFRTVIAAPGQGLRVNPTGGPGMASGGSGDVLAGLLGALIAQGLPPFEAAIVATHLHGRAGDLAENERGEMSLVASDLVRHFPAAVASLFAGNDSEGDNDFEGDDDFEDGEDSEEDDDAASDDDDDFEDDPR